MNETQDAPRVLVEEVEFGGIECQPLRLAFETRTNDLETAKFPAQRDTAIVELGSGLEVISILHGLMHEIAHDAAAEKQNRRLPGAEATSIMDKLTNEHVNHSR